MNLTDVETFSTALTKHSKNRVNQKIKFPLDTKRCIREIAIQNAWNTHSVQILREICIGNFIFKENLLIRIPKPIELSHKCIKINFKYQETEFYYRLFDKSENGPFEVPLGSANIHNKNSVPMLQRCMFIGK